MDASTPATGKTTTFYIKRIAGAILLLAMAATFFYSAYSKCGIEFMWHKNVPAYYHINLPKWLPIVIAETPQSTNAFDSFQWTFLNLGINSIFVAGLLARLMIGAELMLGLFLLLHIFLRRFTYKAVIAVLAIFIIYLLVVIARQGNSGNCGCFGNNVAMTPLQAIIKNLVMIGVTVVLMYTYPVKPYKHQEFVLMGACLVAFSIPFSVNLMYTGTAPEAYTKPMSLDALYKYTPAPSTDLRKGKQIVAFMSLTCPHCKKAAYLLHTIHVSHPDIPMYIILDGPDTDSFKKQFFDETHASDVPNLYYHHPQEFLDMAGSGVPAIYWMNNGVPEYKSVYAYYQLDPSYMEDWLHNKKISQ